MLTTEQITGAAPLPEPSEQKSFAPIPSTDARNPYHVLAAFTSSCIPFGSLYLQDNKFVTIDSSGADLKLREMSKLRLPTWLAENGYCHFTGAKPKNAAADAPAPQTSLSPAMAEIIMASDVFRSTCPELLGLSTVRLPIIASTTKGETLVYREDGSTCTKYLPQYHFEPTAEGYDTRSKIFTKSTVKVDFSKTISLARCRTLICKAFSESPLDGGLRTTNPPVPTPENPHPPDPEAGLIHPLQSRSLGAAVCAMIGQFLHHCIDRFPMIQAIANQPGCGKTFIIKAILAPTHGQSEAANYIDDDKEFRQTLNAMLFDGSRFCFLDDLKHLKSPSLNRFVTTPFIKDRILHSQTTFNKPQRMQFFATGNKLQSTPDIARRSLYIDLFYAGDATQRTYSGVITEEDVESPGTRALFLTALWSMVKAWEESGCPRYIEKAPGGTFQKYVELAANITIHAGFANPYGPRMVDLDSGDAPGKALQEVLIVMADAISPAYGQAHRGTQAFYRVADLERYAERLDKLDIIVPWGSNKRDHLGQAMRAMKGRQLTDSRGRTFEIGSKRDSASSRYRFVLLSEPTRELSAAAYEEMLRGKGEAVEDMTDDDSTPFDD